MTGIIAYQPRFAGDFKRLNLEWLEGHGLLEPADLLHLDQPQTILDAGGQIFIALENDIAVGTCALCPRGAGVMELEKLAVTASARGTGLGRALATRAIDHARALGMRRLVLVSNSRLTAALALYESLGFHQTPMPADNPYATADTSMALDL